MKKFIKKHFNKFFIGILTLISAIAIGIGISSNYNKSYAYTYDDETGYITTDNLINLDTISHNGIGYYYGVSTGYSVNVGTFTISFNYIVSTTTNSSVSLGLGNITSYLYDLSYGTVVTSSYNGLYSLSFNITENLINNYGSYLHIRFARQSTNSSYSFTASNFMLNVGTTALEYEPYGTFINKDLYDDLQSDYNDLETSYNTLNNNYTTLQSNYNTLSTNFNNLQNQYDTLNSSYMDLQTEYTTLQTLYQSLTDNYNRLNNYYTYGNLAFINNINIYDSSNDYEITFNELVSNSYINNYVLEIGNLYNSYTLTGINKYIDIYINDMPITLFDLKLQDFANGSMVISLYNGSYKLITLNSSQLSDNILNYDYLYSIDSDINGYLIKQINIENLDYQSSIYEPLLVTTSLNTASYQNGYNSGYINGSNSVQSDFNYYKNNHLYSNTEYNSLLSEIESLNSSLTSMQLTINSLNEQISSFSSDYGINNMLWTIASTPFESFKNIWNVDFFGINISNLITGFLTGLIVIWVIKKLFL